MKFSDEQMRDILAVKEKIAQKIKMHKDEIELLEKNIVVLDSIIRQTSFTKASQLETKSNTEPMTSNTEQMNPNTESMIPITKNTDGSVIANAYVTPEKVSIVLEDEVGLQEEIPPFKSFFIDRIIGEMKKKDRMDVENGEIEEESTIDVILNKNGATLREIIIKNYRQKDRINEIINTASWSLSKMIENAEK